jgi:hypothetical protein
MSLPNLIIAGAPKSGTTSLYTWLAAHPEVVTSDTKETYYLIDPGYPLYKEASNYQKEGIEGYSKLFPKYHSGMLCMEATPDYMYQQTALNVLSALDEPPIVIFILRNPVERLLSLYEFARNNIGSLGFDVSVAEFLNAVKNNDYTDDKILNESLIQSSYHIWLERWFQSYDKSKIIILFFDDLSAAPASFMLGLCGQLKIDPHFYKNFKWETKNNSVQIRSQKLLFLRNYLQKKYPVLGGSSLVKRIYRLINVRDRINRPVYDQIIINELCEFFRVPNEKLKLLIDRALPVNWL